MRLRYGFGLADGAGNASKAGQVGPMSLHEQPAKLGPDTTARLAVAGCDVSSATAADYPLASASHRCQADYAAVLALLAGHAGASPVIVDSLVFRFEQEMMEVEALQP